MENPVDGHGPARIVFSLEHTSILIRILVVVIGCAVFGGTSLLLDLNQPLAIRIASGMLGENWYRIQLSAEHVGYMYNHVFLDHLGRWHFTTTTHFQLQDDAPNTLSKHLLFSARPPYALEQASYNNHQAQQNFSSVVARGEHGYQARLERGSQTNEVALDWHFDLPTFVAFEQWLATTAPEANQQQVAKSLDLERLRITQRAYRVVEHNEQGYLVETNAPFSATQTQLDEQFRPVRLNMAGVFDVIATDEADAIALKEMRRKTNYLFTVDQRLSDHTSINRLHLRLNNATEFELPDELILTSNPVVSSGDGSEHSGEELRYPITHPKIQSLVQKSYAGMHAGNSAIAQLVNTAHQQLRYAENKPAGSVLTALARGEGECTDYADLFTTLARAAGFPARNVYGLAYKDGTTPAFMFHAWNEVYRAGEWQAVDPTWNQTKVDATHIPLTDAQAARMMLANNTGQISFHVLSKEY